MAATQILAPGQSAASSSVVTVVAGAPVTVAQYTTSGEVPGEVRSTITLVTPGAELVVGVLAGGDAVVLSGPGGYQVNRPDISKYGKDVGICTA